MSNENYNPDVLSCLANLSNDEVFTPPEIVNKMLDMLPEELWSNREAKFLDPFTKSGVFLREIAKRLINGLAEQIPNLQERLDHIFQNQLYGIAITELTSLLSRRSLYCSKYPNCKFSVSKFDNTEGNIRFRRISHTWSGNKCMFCGATKEQYNRADELESHAYEFIHTYHPERILNMKFDVIIGNPPYQLSDGGGNGSSAIPLYNKFIESAKKLNPRYLSMIVPARWYAGGRGLDDFRKDMLNDKHIRVLHDYLQSSDCFTGVQIEGGVCYFLWDRDNKGKCQVYTHSGDMISKSERFLLEPGSDTFIRQNIQVDIYKKVKAFNEPLFENIVSANDPFGFDMRQANSYKRIKPKYELTPFENSVKFYYFKWQKLGLGYIDKNSIRKNIDDVNKWKIFISKAYGMGKGFPTQVTNKPFIVEPNTCCTETYLSIGPFDNKTIAENVISYMQTKFFRNLVLSIKNTQMCMKPVYHFVPMQDFSKPWTDEELYKKYNLTKEEIDFIESTIKPMDEVESMENGDSDE